MTTNEITILLNKVKAVIDNYKVFGHSDQDEGSNWTEYWSIDNTGRIVGDGEIYENFDEFKDNWL